jgi:hypothetical protein
MRSFVGPRHKWKNDIRIDIKGTVGWECVDSIHLSNNMDQWLEWLALVNTVESVVFIKGWKFLGYLSDF